MNEIQVRDLLFEMFPPEADSDWDDVLRRAKRPSSSIRRLTLLVAVALLAVLAVGSALALTGRLGGLFHGTPVNDLTPRERFLLSEFDMNGKVELIARRNSRAFFVIRRNDGRLCYSIGEIQKNLTPAQAEARTRFGGGSCIDARVFPSKAMPVLNSSYYSYRTGEAEARLAGLEGFAADPVARIGVIGRDKRIAFTLPVENNVYTAGKKSFPGARGVVALDKDENVLWVQCFAIGPSPSSHFPSGGCGKYRNSPPPKVRYVAPAPASPSKPARPRGPLVVQRGTADGVSVVVRGSEIKADFSALAPDKRHLLVYRDGRIVFGCIKIFSVGGSKTATGTYVTQPFMTIFRVRPYRAQSAPFDACTATGTYGRTWNDRHGTHDLIEIPLTQRGRTFLAERAAARDIAWLARARVFHDIRYAKQQLSTHEVVRRLGSHVVPLDTPEATPPTGKLGIWIGGPRRIVLVQRATTGRRLYLEIRRGVKYRTNLLGLTQVL